MCTHEVCPPPEGPGMNYENAFAASPERGIHSLHPPTSESVSLQLDRTTHAVGSPNQKSCRRPQRLETPGSCIPLDDRPLLPFIRYPFPIVFSSSRLDRWPVGVTLSHTLSCVSHTAPTHASTQMQVP